MDQFEKLLKILTTQGFIFEFLKESDIEAHQKFVSKNWPNKPFRYHLTYNSWKFKPVQKERLMNLIVCKVGDEVVGQIGYVYGRFYKDGKLYDAYWGSNFKVNDELKSLGIGAGLEIFASRYFKVLLSNTPSNEALKYKKQLGYSLLEGSRTVALPIRINHLIGLKTPAHLKKYIPAISFFANPLLLMIRKIQTIFTSDTCWIPGDVDALFERIKNKQDKIKQVHIKHDIEFLKWRLNPPSEIPGIKPEILIHSKNANEYVVFRSSEKIIYLYDYCFSSTKSVLSFLKYILLKRPSSKINSIMLQANNVDEERLFKKHGCIFFRTKSVITAFSKESIFADTTSMYIDLYDGEGDFI